jgi:hypothetical protein
MPPLQLLSFLVLSESANVDLIKGVPGRWIEPQVPVRIPQDRGARFVDQNAARNPEYPLEPLFRSIFTVKPDFDPKEIDIVSDRNNIRKLFSIISERPIDDFLIKIELVGDTLLLTRRERQAREAIIGFHGFGHEFEKRFTSFPKVNELDKSTGHHRVIQYELGGLKVILRFEVDSYDSTLAPHGNLRPTSHQSIDDLTGELRTLALNQGPEQVFSSDLSETNLVVRQGGFEVSHKSLIEIKTRAARRPILLDEVGLQLWFAQICHLKIGYHKGGAFQRVETRDFEKNGDFEALKQEYGNDLKRLVVLVRYIKGILKSSDKKRATLVFEKGELWLHEQIGDRHALPPDLMRKWDV